MPSLIPLQPAAAKPPLLFLVKRALRIGLGAFQSVVFDFLVDLKGEKHQPKKTPEAKLSVVFSIPQKHPKPKLQHCQKFSFLKPSFGQASPPPAAVPPLSTRHPLIKLGHLSRSFFT